jgi:hypothetical protein
VVLEDFLWLGRDLQIFTELPWRLFLLLRLQDRCCLLDSLGYFMSATNNVRPNQGGATTAARHPHDLEVEDEGLPKDIVKLLCTVRCFI